MASCPIECDFLNEAEHTCSLFREGLSYLGPTKMRPAAIHEPIPFKGMHVDHLIPLARGGADSDDNYMPACPTCNHYKHTLTLDDFREQIGLLTGRLRERVYIYKLALRHGRISESSEPVIFYFEQLTKDKNGATQ